MFASEMYLKKHFLSTELIESAVYLYQATKDPFFLEVGRNIMNAIEQIAWTPCGYATVSFFFRN